MPKWYWRIWKLEEKNNRPWPFDSETSQILHQAFEELRIKDEKDAETFWESLSYADKCNAFHAVVSRIVEGELKKKGTYRYILYDVFGFDLEMYSRGMDCGYMALHNAIDTQDDGK
jgi:hypothetical protein